MGRHGARGRGVCSITQAIEQSQGLPEPPDVDLDEGGLSHTAGTSSGSTDLFRNICRAAGPYNRVQATVNTQPNVRKSAGAAGPGPAPHWPEYLMEAWALGT